ncbi:hypothetical protein LCGC14_0365000 [marine sediment metagenome]|uniref:Uncharacterized protein n=1 Tax=marine sediment metagenome TaxID=412755 RepID=A0A0F9WFE8_9ZZZZ
MIYWIGKHSKKLRRWYYYRNAGKYLWGFCQFRKDFWNPVEYIVVNKHIETPFGRLGGN